MAYGWPPSHRNPKGLQPEVCDLCGAIVPVALLGESMVEGLRGYAICGSHTFESRAMATPSFNDYQAIYPPIQDPDSQVRQQPIGSEFWWEDPLNE